MYNGVTAEMVNEVRKATFKPMMDCKKALYRTEGDVDKAIDYLESPEYLRDKRYSAIHQINNLCSEEKRMPEAVPVKYMVVKGFQYFNIIDTSFEGQGETVCKCKDLRKAHFICRLLNHNEGYEYPEYTA